MSSGAKSKIWDSLPVGTVVAGMKVRFAEIGNFVLDVAGSSEFGLESFVHHLALFLSRERKLSSLFHPLKRSVRIESQLIGGDMFRIEFCYSVQIEFPVF